jgi:hypothetical protein
MYSSDTQYKTLLRVLEELDKSGISVKNLETEFSEDVDNW